MPDAIRGGRFADGDDIADYFGIAFRLYPTEADLTDDGDEALVLRSQDGGQTRLELVLVNVLGGIDLMARYWADVGNGYELVDSSSTGVTMDAWQEVSLLFEPSDAGETNGRFAWWIDNGVIDDETDLDTPASLEFDDVAVGLLSVDTGDAEVIVDLFGIGGLLPGDTEPLVIRPRPDEALEITGDVTIQDISCVHLKNATVSGDVLITEAPSSALANCIVTGNVDLVLSDDALAFGNTFDYTSGANSLTVTDSDPAVLRNNIFLNDGDEVGWTTSSGPAPDSDFNCYWPQAGDEGELNSINDDPDLDANYFISDSSSPVVGAADPAVTASIEYYDDVRGFYRDAATPCMGAHEIQFESATADAAGRITTRTVAGRDYYYGYDAAGRLVDYTDTQNSDNDASYTYDQAGRRIFMTIGTTNIRMVYQGEDVVAEYTDYDDDDVADKKRIYWTLPRIDQRIGFVDYDAQGDPSVYYYLTDQVGSVIQIVDEDGVVVNQYDYDAFGNIHWENSFEGVENRYRFQGREWDEHRQDYYFRMRTYVPEWGQFTGPDMDIRLEGEGIMNYLFALNSPLVYVDPTGLIWGLSECGAYARSILKDAKNWVGHVGRGIGVIASPSEWGMTGGAIQNGMVDRYTPGFVEDDSYFNGLSLGVHDIAGGTNLAEARYGADVVSGEKLTKTERWSRTLIGFGKALNATAIVAGVPGTTSTIGNQVAAAEGSVLGAAGAEARQIAQSLTTLKVGKKTYRLGGRASKSVSDVADEMATWLGPDAKAITNRAGDRVFVSADGARRIRFDIQRPHPHQSPHGHVEMLQNGKWVKSGPLYPTDVPKQ